ncbi:multidrug resistance protein [Streptomyces mashuensis]|uniref:Multidrug resistance protein n=1 Tax=Streptomyces mashuensis TaxID=33904 RepID=A0A919EEJ0_9ACTN|nr:MFS transporter [Streptomyces mashuensis]GHF64936.1 multidrug resistance protein [Streptomyces mashuensis]
MSRPGPVPPAVLPRTTEDGRRATPWARCALLYAFLFLMGAETFLVSPLLPTIAADLRVDTGAAARVVTAYVLTYAIAAPLVGGVSDRFPRRVPVAAGGVLFLCGNVLCATAGSLDALTAARALTGLGGATAAPAMWAYFAEAAAPAQRGRAVAGGVACYALGQVLGVPLGGLLAGTGGWPWAFAALAAGLAPVVVLVAWRLRGPRPAPRKGRVTAGFTVWRDRRVALPLLSTGLLQAGRLGAYTFVGALFAERFGLGAGQLGLVGLLVGAGSLTGSLLAGRTVDRVRGSGRDENGLSAVLALLFVAAAVVTLAASQLAPALAALFVWFVAGGAFYTTQQTYLGGAAPAHRASVVAWNGTLDHLGVAVGTTALSPWQPAGPAFVAVTAGLGVAAAALSATAARLNARRQGPR